MKLTRTILALFVTVLVLPMPAFGQDEDVSTEVTSNDEVTENIVVASQKSAGDLRRDLWRSEKDFYAIYNKLNGDSLYDVKCTKEAPTGSVIKTQTCRPKFLNRALREGKIKYTTDLDTDSVIAYEIATFRKNLATLVAANPDLKTAAATLNLAHDQLLADKERRANN
jgi:hypothetical protein